MKYKYLHFHFQFWLKHTILIVKLLLPALLIALYSVQKQLYQLFHQVADHFQ